MTTAIKEKFTLHPIGGNDQPFLLQLYASTRADEMAMTGWNAIEQHQFLNMQFNAQHAYYQENYSQGTFDLILQQGVPVGRLYIEEWPAELRIIDIALLPQYRNRGIGSHFLKKLMHRAESVQKRVSIHVERNNPAMVLYNRLGFKKIGEHTLYDLMEWTPKES